MSEQGNQSESGKIAVVTGGSRGIGRNTVENLARRGVNAISAYHSRGADAHAVVTAVKEAGAQAIALQLDAGNVASFYAFVNSAGRGPRQAGSHALRLSGEQRW
jgi:NAD(P)-dependent dehydrogenase (short-subunit alcohol dehydrogenase family)